MKQSSIISDLNVRLAHTRLAGTRCNAKTEWTELIDWAKTISVLTQGIGEEPQTQQQSLSASKKKHVKVGMNLAMSILSSVQEDTREYYDRHVI